MWCTIVLLQYMLLLLQYYYDDVYPAHEAAHGLSRVEIRAGSCKTCTERAEERFTDAMRYFPESKLPEHTTTMCYCCTFGGVG